MQLGVRGEKHQHAPAAGNSQADNGFVDGALMPVGVVRLDDVRGQVDQGGVFVVEGGADSQFVGVFTVEALAQVIELAMGGEGSGGENDAGLLVPEIFFHQAANVQRCDLEG